MQHDQVLKEELTDTNVGFFRDPYRFFSRKLDRYNTDALESKFLFMKNTVILRGEEGAKLFYDKDKFTRINVMPGQVQKPLFGSGTIHATDNEQHEKRKAMFLSILSKENIADFSGILERIWYEKMLRWKRSSQIVLLDEVSEILCRAICEWAEFDLPEANVKDFTRYNRKMMESIGQIGPAHWYGRYARARAEVLVAQHIVAIRQGKKTVSENSASYQVAFYQENGKLLGPRIAAVSLLNVIRPTVAAARMVVFGAHALHFHPEHTDRLRDDYFQEWYAHEIRRYYPFVPGMVARARHDFTWRNYEFKKDTFAFLDIYGTNHDPETWKDPHDFIPERFRKWDGSPYNFIPQGGGDVTANHRCPGEWLTIAILKKSMWLLSQAMDYDVPPQDLKVDYGHLITQPKSGFIMTNIRKPHHVS